MDMLGRILIVVFVGISAIVNVNAGQAPTNSLGMALVTEQNEKIVYSREQLGAQKLQHSPVESSNASAARASGSSFVELYREVIFGANIGGSGMVVHDLDGDGHLEMAMGGGSGFGGTYFWYVVEFDGAENYSITWNSPNYESDIRDIDKLTIDDETFLATLHGDGMVRLFDTNTREEVTSFMTPNQGSSYGFRKILSADIDNDGVVEIVVQKSTVIQVYSTEDYSLEQSIEGYGDQDIIVANVDNDAALEIVAANGYVLELNGTTLTVDWDYSFLGFGAFLSVGDIDADGKLEIIGANAWNLLTTFDADLQSPKWQTNSSQDIDALFVMDIDGDSVPEVLYGDGQWGDVHALNGATGSVLWSIDNPEHGVTNISVADFDSDGDLEVMWGAGASSSGQDNLFIHDLATGANEWISTDLSGPFEPLAVGDVDNDGEDELVFSSFESNSGYDGPVIKVLDAKTLVQEWQSTPEMLSLAWGGGRDIVVADVNNDGLNEIVMATSRTYDGRVVVIDLALGGIREDYIYNDYSQFTQIAVADVDNDDANEIIVGTSNSYVLVINGSSGVIEWNSIYLGGNGGVTSLEVADLDDDAALEIVATNQLLYVFDGVTKQQWQSVDPDYSAVAIVHDNDATYPAIVAGKGNGDITSRYAADLHDSNVITTADSAIVSLASLKSADLDAEPRFAYASEDVVRLFDVKNEIVLWESGGLGSSVGANDSLKMDVIDKAYYMVVGRQSGMLYLQSDSDEDSFADNYDNCVNVNNESQYDSDGDGIGNACDGDILEPNDCLVNFNDAEVFKQAFLVEEGDFGWNASADFNSDGAVNFLDYSIFIEMLTQGTPGSSGMDNQCN